MWRLNTRKSLTRCEGVRSSGRKRVVHRSFHVLELQSNLFFLFYYYYYLTYLTFRIRCIVMERPTRRRSASCVVCIHSLGYFRLLARCRRLLSHFGRESARKDNWSVTTDRYRIKFQSELVDSFSPVHACSFRGSLELLRRPCVPRALEALFCFRDLPEACFSFPLASSRRFRLLFVRLWRHHRGNHRRCIIRN